MKQRLRSVSFLLVGFFITFVCLIPGKTFAAFQPEWVQTHISGTLKMQNLYFGAGFTEYKGESPGYDALRLANDDIQYKHTDSDFQVEIQPDKGRARERIIMMVKR